MTEKVKVSNADGRHRVAYEMAMNMWIQSKSDQSNLEDQDEFIELVMKCTRALVHHQA